MVRRLTLLLLAAWLLAAASVGPMVWQEASAAQPQGVSRPAPGGASPSVSPKSLSPKKRHQRAKLRIAHLRNKIARVERKIQQAEDEKRKRALGNRAKFFRIRLARLIRIDQQLSRHLTGKKR